MLNKSQLQAIMSKVTAENLEKFTTPLSEAMDRFQINTPQRMACFLAQIAHESGCLRYVKEIYTGEKYDVGQLAKNLGNTPEDDGDGEKFIGRGILQITGRTNYAAVGKALGVDFLTHPELLEGPVYATMSAAWFWDTRKLNEISDHPDTWTRDRLDRKTGAVVATYNKFEWITFRINGGQTNIEDRKKYYELAKHTFGI